VYLYVAFSTLSKHRGEKMSGICKSLYGKCLFPSS